MMRLMTAKANMPAATPSAPWMYVIDGGMLNLLVASPSQLARHRRGTLLKNVITSSTL